MTSRNNHTPPTSAPSRRRCPVCHEAVYSPAGIHPQCAIRQNDGTRPKPKPADPAEAGEAEASSAELEA